MSTLTVNPDLYVYMVIVDKEGEFVVDGQSIVIDSDNYYDFILYSKDDFVYMCEERGIDIIWEK